MAPLQQLAVLGAVGRAQIRHMAVQATRQQLPCVIAAARTTGQPGGLRRTARRAACCSPALVLRWQPPAHLQHARSGIHLLVSLSQITTLEHFLQLPLYVLSVHLQAAHLPDELQPGAPAGHAGHPLGAPLPALLRRAAFLRCRLVPLAWNSCTACRTRS